MYGRDIYNLVKVKLEEYSPYTPDKNGPLLQGNDAFDEVDPIFAYIKEHLAEAANEMLLIAPLNRLYYKECANTAHEDDDDIYIGRVELPSDYLRIHTFKMECWKKALHDTAKIGDPVYSQQVYPATRGHIWKPVAVEELGLKEGGTVDTPCLIYYSTDGDHTVETYKYIPTFNENGMYDSMVAELIALNCAKKVCEVFERTEALQIINKEMQHVLQELAL